MTPLLEDASEQDAAMRCMASCGGLTLEEARHITEGQARAARLSAADQILARAWRSVSIDLDLLRSSGAMATPVDQQRAGLAHNKARRQAGNAKRLMSALWRYLTGPSAW